MGGSRRFHREFRRNSYFGSAKTRYYHFRTVSVSTIHQWTGRFGPVEGVPGRRTADDGFLGAPSRETVGSTLPEVGVGE